MDEIMLRSIAAKVINGKLLEGVFLALPQDKSQADPGVIEKISTFIYGEPPINFTPEWVDFVCTLVDSVAKKHPENTEPMIKALNEIAAINNAVLGRA